MNKQIEGLADQIEQTREITLPYRVKLPSGRYYKGPASLAGSNYYLSTDRPELATALTFCRAWMIALPSGGTVEAGE